MPHPRPNTPLRYGFTLVEMSIVLVIIGLLVGGILGMQTYVRNASLTTMMNESKVLISAFQQFQTRYGAPAGDYINANATWPAATNGDGNGLIRATAAAPGNRDEWFYVFQQLALGGFIQGTYTGATTGGIGTYHAKRGTNVPDSSVDGTAFMFDAPDFTDGSPDGFIDSSDTFYFAGNYVNVLQVAGLAETATSMPNTGFLTPREAYQIDDKFDDGKPGTGTIFTPEGSATGVDNCADGTDNTAAIYETSVTTKTCYLLIKVE